MARLGAATVIITRIALNYSYYLANSVDRFWESKKFSHERIWFRIYIGSDCMKFPAFEQEFSFILRKSTYPIDITFYLENEIKSSVRDFILHSTHESTSVAIVT